MYDDTYLICAQYTKSNKFTVFTWKLAEKNKSVSSWHECFKILFKLKRKKLNKNIVFLDYVFYF